MIAGRTRQALRRRYLDLLCSIYLYNEYRGYTSIDRVLEAIHARHPDDLRFQQAVAKHRADERKHYMMFRRWFELSGTMPYAIDRTCGHIDRFVELLFGRSIDALDTGSIVADDALFERLCRVIVLTEQRGYAQVETLLRSPAIRSDPVLVRIFTIIRKDEPSHWTPYSDWLARSGRPASRWQERMVDFWIHRELILFKLPLLFVQAGLVRRTDWADERA